MTCGRVSRSRSAFGCSKRKGFGKPGVRGQQIADENVSGPLVGSRTGARMPPEVIGHRASLGALEGGDRVDQVL